MATFISGTADGADRRYERRPRVRRITSEAVVAAEPQAAWDLHADVEGSVEWVPFAEEILYGIEVEPAEGGARIRQSVELRSRLRGPFGWLHEQVFGLVAGRGIRQAVAAAGRRLDGR